MQNLSPVGKSLFFQSILIQYSVLQMSEALEGENQRDFILFYKYKYLYFIFYI